MKYLENQILFVHTYAYQGMYDYVVLISGNHWQIYSGCQPELAAP